MAFPPDSAAIPRNFNMENTLMRRTEGFDYCVAGSRAAGGLQTLLKHGLVVCLSGGQGISPFQLIPQGITNKTSSSFEPAVYIVSGLRCESSRWNCGP